MTTKQAPCEICDLTSPRYQLLTGADEPALARELRAAARSCGIGPDGEHLGVRSEAATLISLAESAADVLARDYIVAAEPGDRCRIAELEGRVAELEAALDLAAGACAALAAASAAYRNALGRRD